MDHRSGLIRSLAGAVLLLVSGLASAATTISHFPPNPGVLPGGGWVFGPGTTFADPPPPRSWVNGVYGGVAGTKATDAIKVVGPAGEMVVGVGRAATARAVGAAAARCLLLLNPWCAAGTAIYLGYEHLRVKPNGSGLTFDPGQPQSQQTLTCGSSNQSPTFCAPDINGVANKVASHLSSTCYGCINRADYRTTNTFSVGACTATSCKINQTTFWIDVTRNTSGSDSYPNVATVGGSLSVVPACPAVVDYYDPKYSVPGGPLGVDGKCPSGQYAPLTEDQAATKFAANPPPDLSVIAQDAIKGGQAIEAEPAGVSGPVSQTGTPVSTTTTNPNGTSNTTTKTPSYQFQYGNDRFTYLSVATIINNNAGDITTTTTTTNPPGPVQDPEDPCVKNPETIGCKKLDTPQDVDLGSKEIPVVFQPDSGWGAGDASCPAPHVVMIQGQSITMDNTLICGFMSGIRFAVIGVAGLCAAFIFIGGIKE